ncbi:hypothetical protein C0J52_02543 [Blattella germanica]|nr:hypothetical protein C0J52_02543 [Blattella germanica]
MLRNGRIYTQVFEYFQYTGLLRRGHYRAQSQYFGRLCINDLDKRHRFNITTNILKPQYSLRLYSIDSKGKNNGKSRAPGTTKTVEECLPFKGSTSAQGKYVCKPVSTVPPPRPDCNKPHLMKDTPQPDCPYDDGPSSKKYIRHIVGGILLLLASVLTLYYLTPKKEEVKVVEKKRGYSRKIKRPRVLVVNQDGYFPYMRPPLSKEMWFNDSPEITNKLHFKQWNGSERSLFYEPEDFYVDCNKLLDQANGGVAVARGWSIKKLNVYEKKAILEDDTELSYEKCLIATGASPINLPIFEDASDDIKEKVTLYRGIFDFEELNDIIKSGAKSLAVIGGGFLGSELACALARQAQKTNCKIYQVFREPGNMGKVLPEYLSSWTTDKVRSEGVSVISDAEVEDIELSKKKLNLALSNGEKVFEIYIVADHVVVAVGVKPNTELAEPSGLEVDEDFGGFLVNAELMARSNLWIVSYEAIGIVDSTLPTVGVFCKATEKDTPKAVVAATDEGNRAETEASATPVSPAKSTPETPKPGEDYGKGVIFYLREDSVVGIVMWNVFNRMSIARQVLKEERKYDDLNEVAKLFNIHEE